MKLLVHLEEMKDSFQKLFRRFPLETVILVMLTGVIMYSIHTEIYTGWIRQIIYSLIVTFFFLVSVTLYCESRKAKKWDILLPILPILYGIGFYTVNSYAGDFDLEATLFFLLHLFGFVFAIVVAPYIGKIRSPKENTIQYANYFTLVAWTGIMSGIVGGAVLLLGFIAIGSVTELFDLTGDFFWGKIYGYWVTLALSLIAPLYALMHFPDLGEIKKDTYDTNRFFSFLVRFIGIPFILIYFIILYAYSVRVLANFHDWPNGIISWLVIGFSTFGYLIYIFSESYGGEGKIIAPFRKYFPLAVLPQVFMLFYAIYLRIAQYDLTMNRYFVVIFGVWLMTISLYYTISKQKNILILPATIAIISMAISFGPWGVFTLPLDRQYSRFIGNIEKIGVLQNGEIHPLTKSIDASLENEILSEVEYICEYRTCEKIRPLFRKVLSDAEEKSRQNWGSSQSKSARLYSWLSSWEATNAIEKAMNVQRRYDTNTLQNTKYITLSVDYNQRDSYYPIDLTGYQNLLKVQGTESSALWAQFVSIDPEHDSLTIRDGADTETISLSAIKVKLQAKYGNNPSYNVDQKDIDFTLIGNKHEMRVILESYSYKNPKYEENSNKDAYGLPSINGIALVKKRN